MVEPAQPAPLSGLTEALYLHADVASMTRILTSTLAGMLPAHVITVQRRRSAADRLTGRPGTPVAVEIRLGERELGLHARSGAPEASISHVVRGVTLSTTPVPVTEWITTLAGELQRMAAEDERARAALERFLLE